MRSALRVLPLLVVTLTGISTAVAADHPVAALPESSAIVIKLAPPDQTVQKAVDYVANVKAEYAPFVSLAGAAAGNLINNPSQTGVDRSRDWWMALVLRGTRPPAPVFAIPVTDAEQFRNAVIKRAQFFDYEDWVVFTPDEDVATEIKARLDGQGESIESRSSDRVRQLFAENDIAIFVDVNMVTREYSEQIEQARNQIREALEQLQNFSPSIQGLNMKPIFDLYSDMLAGVFQAIEDADSLTYAVSISADALTIEELMLVAEGSKSDEFLKRQPTSKFSHLGRLTTDELAYVGLRGDMSGMVRWGLKFWEAMAADQENLESISQIMKEFTEIEFGDYYATFRMAGMEEGALRSTVVSYVKPVAKMKSITRQMGSSLKMQVSGVEQEITIEEAAETLAGTEIDIMRVKQEFSPEIDPLQMQQQIMDIMYGPDGALTRIAYTDEAVIQVIGHPKSDAEAALKRWNQSSIQASDAVTSVRSALPEEANLIVLFDVPNFGVSLLRLVVEHGQLPVPFNEQTVDALKQDASYGGMALATEPQGLRFKAVIPAQQVAGIVKIVEAVQKSMTNRPEF